MSTLTTPVNEQNTAVNTILPAAKQPGRRYVPPPSRGPEGEITGYAVQTINADRQALYTLWRDYRSLPLWQEYVVSVTPVGGGVESSRSHWVLGDPTEPNGKRVEFDSELTEDVPGEKLAWTAVSGDVDQSGSVTFAPAFNGRGTLVTLIQNTKVPGGALGNAFAALAKRGPRQIVIENLRHFKQLAETGEIPTVEGQPNGPRGVQGKAKQWMYGENNPTPPGTSL